MPEMPQFSRRTFVRGVTAAGAAVPLVALPGGGPAAAAPAVPLKAGTTAAPEKVALRWLEGTPAAGVGSTWGVPWPKGAVASTERFALAAADGADVPVQTWP